MTASKLLARGLATALIFLPALASGCTEAFRSGGPGGGEGGGSANAGPDPGAGGGTAVPDAGGLACEAELLDAAPETPEACAACLCAECQDALAECRDTPSCIEDLGCAQASVADGTCVGDITGAGCITSKCGLEVTDTPSIILLCIVSNCAAECVQ